MMFTKKKQSEAKTLFGVKRAFIVYYKWFTFVVRNANSFVLF